MHTTTISVKNDDGTETSYQLVAAMNPAVELEKLMKTTIGALLDRAGALDMVAVRSLMWWFLQHFHAKDFPTGIEVGKLLDRMGGPVKFFEVLQMLAPMDRGQTDRPAETPAAPPVALAAPPVVAAAARRKRASQPHA